MPQKKYNVAGVFEVEDKEEVETYLREIDGVNQVQVNLNAKMIIVDFDPAVVQSAWLKETLQSLGHSAEVLN